MILLNKYDRIYTISIDGRISYMLRIAVCDDELNEVEKIQDYGTQMGIRRNMEIEVDGFTDGDELLKNYTKGKYQIVMLDVEMGRTDGLLVAGRIRRIPDHDVIIMYVSRYPQYMQASFDVRAAQYISKPLTYDVFEEKILAVLRYKEQEIDKDITFTYNEEKNIVSEKDIIVIESSGLGNRNLKVTTVDDSFIAKGKISDYSQICSKYMIAPNRSELINVEHIRKLVQNRLLLRNGREITISRNRIGEINEKVVENFVNRMK